MPVPAGVPPHDAEYHLAVAPVPAVPPAIFNVVLPLHIAVIPVMLVGATDAVLKVTVCEIQSVVLQSPS